VHCLYTCPNKKYAKTDSDTALYVRSVEYLIDFLETSIISL